MNRVEIALPDYLRPPCENVWRWEDNGDSIVWYADPVRLTFESTAAFNVQLQLILGGLLERVGGLPPMTSVLFVIQACQGGWAHREVVSSRLTRISGAAGHSTALHRESLAISRITCWLESISRLPAELRRDVESQIAILTLALQDAPQSLRESTGDDAARALEHIAIASTDHRVNWAGSAAASFSVPRANQTIQTLIHMSLRHIDAHRLDLWRRALVATEPDEAPLEIVPPSRDPIQQTLRKLSADESWGSIARTAIDAASLLSLPRRPSDPDMLPIGGVSDVTNRGEPERLLMTELAADPLVMLARIASGRALYLRRETPPGPSPRFRPVLLECGIRTWGTVRLQIASVAMAIAAAEERRGETAARLITVAGDRCFGEDFATSEGIVAHLERLEPDEHPGNAVADWIEAAGESDELIADPIVVVSSATDDDPRFRQSLDKMPTGFLVVRIERDATATLIRRSSLGDEVLQSISLTSAQPSEQSDLRPIADTPRLRTDDSSMALFLDVHPCPLRFSDHLDGPWVAASTTPGVFTVTRDKRLLWFDRKNAGGIQLIERMPSQTVLAHEIDQHQLTMVVGVPGTEHHIVQVDTSTSETRFTRLDIGRSRNHNYVFDQGSLFRVGREIELIDRTTGAIIAQNRVAPRQHLGGPMVRDRGQLCLFSEQAGEIVMHEMSEPFSGTKQQSALAVRDNNGTIVVVDNLFSELAVLDGSSTATTLQTPLGIIDMNLPAVDYRSADGNILIVHERSAALSPRVRRQKPLKIDIEKREITEHSVCDRRRMLALCDPRASEMVRPRNLLCRLAGVSFDQERVYLVMKRDREWSIIHNQSMDRLQLKSEASVAGKRHYFGQSVHPETPFGHTRWRLRSTKVGGNHLIADTRGLLHLRRGDDQTELTLVMHDTHVSGWASWGTRFGDSYFTAMETTRVPVSVVQWLKEFAKQCSQSS